MEGNGDQIQIVIKLISNDTVQISGPLADKILCLGMLERAKDAVREFKPSRIIPARDITTDAKDVGNG